MRNKHGWNMLGLFPQTVTLPPLDPCVLQRGICRRPEQQPSLCGHPRPPHPALGQPQELPRPGGRRGRQAAAACLPACCAYLLPMSRPHKNLRSSFPAGGHILVARVCTGSLTAVPCRAVLCCGLWVQAPHTQLLMAAAPPRPRASSWLRSCTRVRGSAPPRVHLPMACLAMWLPYWQIWLAGCPAGWQPCGTHARLHVWLACHPMPSPVNILLSLAQMQWRSSCKTRRRRRVWLCWRHRGAPGWQAQA